MKNESFESMDERLKRQMAEVPPKRVPPSRLDGFSASVAARIRERGAKPAARRFAVPAFVPAFAVLVLAVVVAGRTGTRLPAPAGPPERPAYVQIASNPNSVSAEIALLRELGAWTEEDEAALGVTDEAALEEVEISRANASPNSAWA